MTVSVMPHSANRVGKQCRLWAESYVTLSDYVFYSAIRTSLKPVK